MTLIAMIALASSAWGTFDICCAIWGDREVRTGWQRTGDGVVLIACASCAITALHSLVATWIG